MQVQFLSSTAGGDLRAVEVPEGTTVLDLFRNEVGHVDLERFFIRVNRQVVAPTHPLSDGDRVTVTPLDIRGAYVPSTSTVLSEREQEDLEDLEAIEQSRSEEVSISWDALKAELGL